MNLAKWALNRILTLTLTITLTLSPTLSLTLTLTLALNRIVHGLLWRRFAEWRSTTATLTHERDILSRAIFRIMRYGLNRGWNRWKADSERETRDEVLIMTSLLHMRYYET